MIVMITDNITQDKSYCFAIRIVKAYRYLTTEQKEFVLSKQLLRSGTSIGANIRERLNAQSKADFINKLQIALKEADESAYWLELLVESETIDNNDFVPLYNDLKEIIAIITASINKMKANDDCE